MDAFLMIDEFYISYYCCSGLYASVEFFLLKPVYAIPANAAN